MLQMVKTYASIYLNYYPFIIEDFLKPFIYNGFKKSAPFYHFVFCSDIPSEEEHFSEDSEEEIMLPVHPKKRKIVFMASQAKLSRAEEILAACKKYLEKASGLRSFVNDELLNFKENTAPATSYSVSVVNSDDDDETKMSNIAGSRRVYKRLFTLRREIELKKIQLEIRQLDYENAYRGTGFKLSEILGRCPELVRDCTCAPASGRQVFCRFHTGAESIATTIYEPDFVERAGCTFIVVDIIAEIIQICAPSGHWLTLYSNQITAVAWHLYYLLIPGVPKPQEMVISLGDGYFVKFINKHVPWFGFEDLEGNRMEFAGYPSIRPVHSTCVRFPDLVKEKLGRGETSVPCIFTHNTISAMHECVTCSTPWASS